MGKAISMQNLKIVKIFYDNWLFANLKKFENHCLRFKILSNALIWTRTYLQSFKFVK